MARARLGSAATGADLRLDMAAILLGKISLAGFPYGSATSSNAPGPLRRIEIRLDHYACISSDCSCLYGYCRGRYCKPYGPQRVAPDGVSGFDFRRDRIRGAFLCSAVSGVRTGFEGPA